MKLEDIINEIITKRGSQWCLMSKKKIKGKRRNLGCYGSRAGAEKRERQVQYFKHQHEDVSQNTQPLTERVHDVVYHFTRITTAAEIMETGVFELTSAVGSSFEQSLAPAGYPYYLSLTRSRAGEYHLGYDSGVLFTLDGSWFNHHYPSAPVDYWEGSWKKTGRTSEQEDRVFSKTHTIPAKAITEVHILLGKINFESEEAAARRLIIAAKKKKIPVWVYATRRDFTSHNKKRALPWSQYKHLIARSPKPRKSWKTTDRIKPWLEIVHKHKSKDLSLTALDIVREIIYHGYIDSDAGLSNELANSRRPEGYNRDSAVKLIAAIRKLKMPSVKEFVRYENKRWRIIRAAEHHNVNAAQITAQVQKGIQVEQEHSKNPDVVFKIAMDHLWEDPNYYTKLDSANL